MNWSNAGIIWTISAAGWFVIATLTGLPQAWLACVGCGAMAGACIVISNSL